MATHNVVRSAPPPPYSSGNGSPNSPSSPIWRITASGKVWSRSQSSACGAISALAKSRTTLRNSSCSGDCSNGNATPAIWAPDERDETTTPSPTLMTTPRHRRAIWSVFATLSYSSGTGMVPLIGQTIGENLEATAARFPDHEALVVRHQGVRLTYARARRRGRRGGARPARRSASRRATRSASGARTTPSGCWCSTPPPKIGVILVNINPAYRTHEVAVRAATSRAAGCWSPPPSFKTSDYRGMVDEVRPTLPDARARWCSSAPATGTSCSTRATACRPTRLRERDGGARLRRRRSTSSTRAARPASRRAPRSATTTS